MYGMLLQLLRLGVHFHLCLTGTKTNIWNDEELQNNIAEALDKHQCKTAGCLKSSNISEEKKSAEKARLAREKEAEKAKLAKEREDEAEKARLAKEREEAEKAAKEWEDAEKARLAKEIEEEVEKARLT